MNKPGTKLKNILKKFGIESMSCECDEHADLMDEMGVEWCRENEDIIVGWLLREAKKRGVILNNLAKLMAKYIVRKALQ